MALCPNGHETASDDLCDVCGRHLGGNPDPDRVRMRGKHHIVRAEAAADVITCPRCGASSPGQFCDMCGYSMRGRRPFAPPIPPEEPRPAPPWSRPEPSFRPPVQVAVATWTVRVASDRSYYDRMLGEQGGSHGFTLAFPHRLTERRIPLAGHQMRIGRRSAARDAEPEIDLAGPPADPGISRLHAILIAGPDGTWSLLDSGSANGTLLNGRVITRGELVPLREGDRINLGAWTAITIHRG